MEMINLILAASIAPHVVVLALLHRVHRGLVYTDMMMMAMMEEGAPKMWADYEKWEARRQHRGS